MNFIPFSFLGSGGNSNLIIEYLIVGGGGAAQGRTTDRQCGGGGAGGFVSGTYEYIPNVSSSSLDIQVGYGAPRTFGATVADDAGADGGNSIFVANIAYGGGGGGDSDTGNLIYVGAGRPGGSGGGGGATLSPNSTQTKLGGTGVSPQGFPGGESYTQGGNGVFRAGSGGGASGPGTSGSLGVSTPGAPKAWLDGNLYAGGGNGNTTTPTYIVSGSGGTVKLNTTVGTEGKNGIVKLRYEGSSILFSGGNIEVSGGYVYHTFLAPTQIEFSGSYGYYNLNYLG